MAADIVERRFEAQGGWGLQALLRECWGWGWGKEMRTGIREEMSCGLDGGKGQERERLLFMQAKDNGGEGRRHIGRHGGCLCRGRKQRFLRHRRHHTPRVSTACLNWKPEGTR